MNQPQDNTGKFLPTWKHTPTKMIRVPEELAPSILRFSKLLDKGIISEEQVKAWLDKQEKTQHLLRQVVVQPDSPRHLRGL